MSKAFGNSLIKVISSDKELAQVCRSFPTDWEDRKPGDRATFSADTASHVPSHVLRITRLQYSKLLYIFIEWSIITQSYQARAWNGAQWFPFLGLSLSNSRNKIYRMFEIFGCDL
jgi:hypothetical protein